MKYALLLFGLYHVKSYIKDKTLVKIDYKKDIDKIKLMIINNLEQNNDTVDVFICSNSVDSIKDLQLCQDYNATSSYFYNIREFGERYKRCASSYISRNRKMLFGLKLIDPSKYDLIICTRFECWLLNNILDYNIQYEKFNFHHQKHNDIIDDNLFIFPTKYYQTFVNFLEKNLKSRGHDFCKLFIKKQILELNEMNFLSDKIF
jgi:hypothetical protein